MISPKVLIEEKDFDLFIAFANKTSWNCSDDPEELEMIDEIDRLVELYKKSNEKQSIIEELSYYLNCELSDLEGDWKEFKNENQ